MSDHGDTISRYNFHHCWACGLVARAGLDKCRRCGCPTSVDSNEGAVDWAYSHWRTLKANRIFAILRPLVTREARRLYAVEIQRQRDSHGGVEDQAATPSGGVARTWHAED